MGAFILDVEHPITDGTIVTWLRAALTGWSGLTVQRKLPPTHTRRMVTVRNDSGPIEGSIARRRYGINVWADTSEDAEQLALDAMSTLRLIPGTGAVVATDQFTGPFEIEDEPAFTVAGKILTHFYFAFRVSVRGTQPA